MNRNDYIEDERERVVKWKAKGKKSLEDISYIDLEGENLRKDKCVEKLWGQYKWWSYRKVLRCQES